MHALSCSLFVNVVMIKHESNFVAVAIDPGNAKAKICSSTPSAVVFVAIHAQSFLVAAFFNLCPLWNNTWNTTMPRG